jgi:hypothetical protein
MLARLRDQCHDAKERPSSRKTTIDLEAALVSTAFAPCSLRSDRDGAVANCRGRAPRCALPRW